MISHPSNPVRTIESIVTLSGVALVGSGPAVVGAACDDDADDDCDMADDCVDVACGRAVVTATNRQASDKTALSEDIVQRER